MRIGNIPDLNDSLRSGLVYFQLCTLRIMVLVRGLIKHNRGYTCDTLIPNNIQIFQDGHLLFRIKPDTFARLDVDKCIGRIIDADETNSLVFTDTGSFYARIQEMFPDKFQVHMGSSFTPDTQLWTAINRLSTIINRQMACDTHP